MASNLFSAWVIRSKDDVLYGPFTSATEAAAMIAGMQESFIGPLLIQPIRFVPASLVPADVTSRLPPASTEGANVDRTDK